MYGRNATRRGAGAAIALVGVVALAFGACGGLQAVPRELPLPSPSGQPVGFRCEVLPQAPPRRGPSALAFDAILKGWPDREGAFAEGQPLHGHGILAKDVHPRWKDSQKSAFPTSNSAQASSLVPIGGDYWSDTTYAVVPDGDGPWISSAFAAPKGESIPQPRGDQPTGAIWKAFTIESNYLRVSVGGDDDGDVGVELLVAPKPSADWSACDGSIPKATRSVVRPPVRGFESYVPVYARRGHGDESVDRYDLPMDQPGCRLKGLKAVIRVFDFSSTAHVNVGVIEPADAPLDASVDRTATPVWGFADFHTHPTSYLGFGGLQGIHTIWGAPGGSIHDYTGPTAKAALNIARDVPPCDDPHKAFNSHHGGFAAPTMIDAAEGRTSENLDDLAQPQLADQHPSQGAPSYRDFPDFRRGAHQQYHITQIHRAYLGGLRLMTALAVHNQGLEYGMGWVRCGADGSPTVDTTADLDVVRAHVQAMRELAEMNQDWMEIAYTPLEARRIIRANKLAVILGVEVAQLGQDGGRGVADQVAELDALGVRHVIVVHGMDNLLAGSAVFQDLYNTVNDWLNRPAKLRDTVQELSGALTKKPIGDATFFQVTTDPSPETALEPREDAVLEPILFRLSNPPRVVLSDVFPHPSQFTYALPLINGTFGILHPLVNTTPVFESEQGPYDEYTTGHRNRRGLSGRGKEFIQRLMQHGMVVDLAHMSDATLLDTYELSNATCAEYPLMASHAHFRRLALKNDYSDRAEDFVERTSDRMRQDILTNAYPMSACVRDAAKCDPVIANEARETVEQAPWQGAGTVTPGHLPREFDLTTYELSQIRERKGTIGVFLGQGPIDSTAFRSADDLPSPLTALPFANDCAGSSKSFAAAMLFAQARMKGAGVGIASDFALIETVAPRFGDLACGAYLDAGSGSASGAQLLETLVDPEQYKMGEQRAPVMYASRVNTCADDDPKKHQIGDVPCGPNAPLVPYVMGQRAYDFNVDGLAHYGLVPDMLQDVANVLRSDEKDPPRLDGLFGSAEAYVEMWQSARSLAACDRPNSACSAPPAGDHPGACGDACPRSWNHGAPLQSLDEVFGICDPGRPIRFPTADASGKPIDMPPTYEQRRADPTVRGDLTQQGDWGVFPIRTRQTWVCGNGSPQLLTCPAGANYVKVRRILDTTIGRGIENCNFQPLPPEAGNRRVVFDCLAGPPDGRTVRAPR